ncbi:DNA-binding protein [Cupriavidus necator]
MGTLAEVLQGCWQELRGRTRVTIDHPELPDALKQVAADMVRTIWQAANEAATGEAGHAAGRGAPRGQVAEAERDPARRDRDRARGGHGDRGAAGRSRGSAQGKPGGVCFRAPGPCRDPGAVGSGAGGTGERAVS